MTAIKNVTVLGTGVLNSQIAFQTAFHGLTVTAYNINPEIIEQEKMRFASLAKTYIDEHVAGAADGGSEAALANISYSFEPGESVKDADLVTEVVPENLEIKPALHTELTKLVPPRTIFTTNVCGRRRRFNQTRRQPSHPASLGSRALRATPNGRPWS